jgi:DNA-binding CsgD family transcriptional regulator
MCADSNCKNPAITAVDKKDHRGRNRLSPDAEPDDSLGPKRGTRALRLFRSGHQALLAGDGGRAIMFYEAAYVRSRAEGDMLAAADAAFIAARQARTIGEPALSLEFVNHAFELADQPLPQLKLSAYLSLGHHLINAGKDREVLGVLQEAEKWFATIGVSSLCDFLELYACASAMQGRAGAATSHFDLLLEMSIRNESVETQVSRLNTAAINATTQGLFARALSLHKRAVNLANRYDLGSYIPFSTVTQAWTSLYGGDLYGARMLLEKTEGWPTNHFYIRYYRSAVGVLLGALVRDYNLIERCLDFGALELAFRSEAPQRIGPIAAGMYEYFIVSGRQEKAAQLLSRSLRAIDNPDECWWLLLQAAQRGTREDVARALSVLGGYSDDFVLARAHRLLLHARAAGLDGRRDACANLAGEAADLLNSLGWRCHHAAALVLAERYAEARHLRQELGIFEEKVKVKSAGRTNGPTLSALQREIGRLVIAGLTNRQIAARLGMAERTIKYHLKGAFDELGCHNRLGLKRLLVDGCVPPEL